jgi:hypothetical protein
VKLKQKIIWSHIVTALVASGGTWLYLRISPPRFWDQRLDIKSVDLATQKEKNVYWARDMRDVRFVMRAGDKCFYITNEDFSFGEANADMMWYDKMIVFCPGKGVGWTTNAW